MNDEHQKLTESLANLLDICKDNAELSEKIDEVIKCAEDCREQVNIQNARVHYAERLASLAEMATGVAHELNQPFNVILMAAQMVRMWIKRGKEIDIDRLDRLMQDIEVSVQRGSKIISHMRQFGSGSTSQTAPLDINRPIMEIFDLLSQQLKAEDVNVEFKLGEDIPPIKADNYQIQQIFFQLISNARDALNEKAGQFSEKRFEKKLIVKTEVDNMFNVSASIYDNGAGILDANLKKIFDPFFTTKEVGKGKGLGLAIIYGLVKDFKGTIEVESDYGAGTKFILKFPAA